MTGVQEDLFTRPLMEEERLRIVLPSEEELRAALEEGARQCALVKIYLNGMPPLGVVYRL